MNSNKLLISSAIIGSFAFTSSARRLLSDTQSGSDNKEVATPELSEYLNQFVSDITKLATEIATSSAKVLETEDTFEEKTIDRKAAEDQLTVTQAAEATALGEHKDAITEADELINQLREKILAFVVKISNPSEHIEIKDINKL